MTFTPASAALSHIRVLDLSRVRAGPTCARQLADWGADVIKIEAPPDQNEEMGGPRHGPDFQNLHRNKRAMTLNFKHADGLSILKRMAQEADVVIENFRPDVKHRLGIDYDALSRDNPGLVYASISGFGQTGPYADRPGFDQIAQGMGGLMSVTGKPGDGPMRAGIPIADLTSGLFAAQGIMVALLERQQSGVGQWLHTSLLEAQIFMLDFQAARYTMSGDVATQAGNDHPTAIPTGVFKTKDGTVNVATAGGAMWRKVCHVIDQPELADHPDYETRSGRSKNREALNRRIEDILLTKTTKHWVDAFNDAGVPAGPIYAIDEVFADQHVKHTEMRVPVYSPALEREIDLVAQPVKLERTPARIVRPPPEIGEHTEDILIDLGYTQDDIADLRKRGTI